MEPGTKKTAIKVLGAVSGGLTVAYLFAPAPFVAVAQGVVSVAKALLEWF